MFEKMVQAAHEFWVESKRYKKESALENEIYENKKIESEKIIGEKAFHDISDLFVDIACEAEYAGFEAGFRYGVKFMQGVNYEKEGWC